MSRVSLIALAMLACSGTGTITNTPGDNGADAGANDPGDGYFPAAAPYYQDITDAPVDANSSAIIAWLDERYDRLGLIGADTIYENPHTLPRAYRAVEAEPEGERPAESFARLVAPRLRLAAPRPARRPARRPACGSEWGEPFRGRP